MFQLKRKFLLHALWLCLIAPAHAAPISASPGTGAPDLAAPARPRMSESELVLSDPRLETTPDLSALSPSVDARTNVLPRPGNRNPGVQGEWEGLGAADLGPGLGGAAVRDALRGYVNVLRSDEQSPRSGAERRRGPQGETLGLAGIDLGPAANEWIQETVQDILSSALRLDVNQRGQASFSVLGLGEFSVNLSPDRTEVAIASGDTVLVTAQRAPEPGSNGYSGNAAGGGWSSGGTSITAGSSVPGESLFRQALELALELASHPLSFLIYGLILTYALLWTVLSRRAQRHQLPRPQSQAMAATFRQPTAAVRSGRKRRHRSRASTQRS